MFRCIYGKCSLPDNVAIVIICLRARVASSRLQNALVGCFFCGQVTWVPDSSAMQELSTSAACLNKSSAKALCKLLPQNKSKADKVMFYPLDHF